MEPAAAAAAADAAASTASKPKSAAPAAAAAASKSKISKGFFKATSDTAAPKSSSSSSAARGATNSSDEGDAVVEIDCAGQQQQQQSSKSSAGTFGAQVQQMAQQSVALQIAINQINSGQVEQAESLLDGILASTPTDLSALVARGTARALRRKLKEAVDDFSKAIAVEPRYPDTYKRRGQARSALGDHQGALDDLDKAAQLVKEFPGAEALQQGPGAEADCLAERGMLYQKLRDYRRAVRELSKATALEANNPQAWNYLGLCKVSMGDIREGCKAYEKAIELSSNMREAWLNLGQALKEEGRVKDAERALTKAMTTAEGQPCLAAYRLLATMRQGQGRQADAIKVLDRALGHNRPEQVECISTFGRCRCMYNECTCMDDICMNSKLGQGQGRQADAMKVLDRAYVTTAVQLYL
eukprot:GHUV01031958.1.p1 GENE.GHUV01031958.1~~GHUV01031958.1.p1  ORF type:complete len:414 (+),score=144.70 GHUV01031958.1:3-1244(+)